MRGSRALSIRPSIRSSARQLVSLLSIRAAQFFVPGLHHAGSSSAADLAGSLVGSANSARR